MPPGPSLQQQMAATMSENLSAMWDHSDSIGSLAGPVV